MSDDPLPLKSAVTTDGCDVPIRAPDGTQNLSAGRRDRFGGDAKAPGAGLLDPEQEADVNRGTSRERRSRRYRVDRQRAVEAGAVRLRRRLLEGCTADRGVARSRAARRPVHGDDHVGRTSGVEGRRRRRAKGNVVMSTTRNRRRVMGAPELLVNVLRRSSVPNVELLAGSDVKSRTWFGTANRFTHESRFDASSATPSRTIGELRFSGPGAPRRWPAPAEVPLVSTKMKSLALLSVSTRFELRGPAVVWIRATLVQFPPPPDPVQPPDQPADKRRIDAERR